MIYLAGPFFNEAQLRLVQEIEEDLTLFKLPFFSPRSQHEEGKPKAILNERTAQDIFQENVNQLQAASAVLAILDYPLPSMFELQLVDLLGTHAPKSLRLPDTGTVWEMGYALGRGIPVFGFTASPPNKAKLNLMLTQGCAGIIYGRALLRRFAAFPNQVNRISSLQEAGIISSWKGDFI